MEAIGYISNKQESESTSGNYGCRVLHPSAALFMRSMINFHFLFFLQGIRKNHLGYDMIISGSRGARAEVKLAGHSGNDSAKNTDEKNNAAPPYVCSASK